MEKEEISMNIYLIQVSNCNDEMRKKFVGYSAGLGDYEALKEMGFRQPHQIAYRQNNNRQDEWKYTAENAVNCFVYATKI